MKNKTKKLDAKRPISIVFSARVFCNPENDKLGIVKGARATIEVEDLMTKRRANVIFGITSQDYITYAPLRDADLILWLFRSWGVKVQSISLGANDIWYVTTLDKTKTIEGEEINRKTAYKYGEN